MQPVKMFVPSWNLDIIELLEKIIHELSITEGFTDANISVFITGKSFTQIN